MRRGSSYGLFDRTPLRIEVTAMAGSTEQGTGKHPHKSAAEPEPHTKQSGSSKEVTSGKESSSSNKNDTSHSIVQGTGKHPHKSAANPKEHHEGAHKK